MRKSKSMKKNKIIKIAEIISIAAVLILTVYCMINGLGLVDGLDFGAGAYFYADIPEFEKYVNNNHFISQFPMWVYIVLFLIWGAMMFKFWVWLDKKWK